MVTIHTPTNCCACTAVAVESGSSKDDDDDPGRAHGYGPGSATRSRKTARSRDTITRQERSSKRQHTSSRQRSTHDVPHEELPLTENVPEVTVLTRVQTPSSNFVLSPCDRFDFEGSFVPFIDFSDIVVGDLLGIGRNGDVFETTYKGESVAVKQFDITKNLRPTRTK
jgi:hypothetical protein